MESTIQRVILGALALSATVYCVLALAYIATSPEVPFRCLIAENQLPRQAPEWITVQAVVDHTPGGPATLRDDPGLYRPQLGDQLLELAGHETRTFVEFSQALVWLRSPPEVSATGEPLVGSLNPGTPLPLDPHSTLCVQEFRGHPEWGRLAKVRFRRGGEEHLQWAPLQRQPLGGLVLSLVWFVLHTSIFALGGLAYWKRPHDQPVRIFFAMCAVTLVAYIGGNHWWVLAGSLWFILPFAVCAILLPAVLLHFFLVYPTPKPFVVRWPRPAMWLVYGLPGLSAVTAIMTLLVSGWLSRSPAWSAASAELMVWLRSAIYSYFVVAALYFGVSLAALLDSYRRTRNPIEHSQVKWILWAGLLAVVPVGITLALAWFDRVGFSYGGARLPMCLASLSFTLAYTVGIARYKLMLMDQVVNRGMLYYVLSFGVTLAFALLIAIAGVAAWHAGSSTYGYAVPVIVLFMFGIIVLAWFRDRGQRAIDRWFFREKYPIDRALQRMNRAVSSLLERGDVADNMLYSCCEVLRVEQAALYLRDGDSSRFRLTAAVGKGAMPLQFDADAESIAQIDEGVSLQRVPSGTSPAQLLLRTLGAELMHGLEVDGELAGLVALGAKPDGAAYTAEDVTFLTAVSRITSVALHCAKVHEDISRLNEELRHKSEQISEQGRQILVLQTELVDHSGPRAALPAPSDFRRDAIKGRSPAMLHVLDTVRKVATSDASVLIRGESGTGKELLARAIHENSPRHHGPLISVHCAALAPSLLESELFGHVRGAFTDAREDKVGRFALANGGTLFLDEIGDISLDVQVKLLRVLQERMFEPVGSSKPVSSDVRVIAATHRNLERAIAEGRFREDLYYRLNVISITLPALRERGDDIFELALFFLRRAAERTGKRVTQFDGEVIAALSRYHWPGNIRELENVVERAVVLTEGERVTLPDIPAELRDGTGAIVARTVAPVASGLLIPKTAAVRTRPAPTAVLVAGSEEERTWLLHALHQCDGNKAEAARLLQMPRSTFFSKLKKHGLS
jgi:transcriptional regulator with GAF, ATPase, and Fis domain